MNNRMNRSASYWLMLAILTVVAVLAAILAASIFLFPRYFPTPHVGPPGNISGDIELFYTIKTVVSTINVTLLIFLLVTYVSIYQRTRSDFTIGLIIFSAAFLIDALLANPFIIYAFGFRPSGLGPFAMLPDLFTCAALFVLLYLSVKY